MATRATDAQPRGLGALAKRVAEHASSLFRLELELAALELKRKVTVLGVGIGLAVGAAVVAVFALGFLFATAAAGLATFLRLVARPAHRHPRSLCRGGRPRLHRDDQDQEGNAARAGTGDSRSEAHDGGVEEQWPVTAAPPNRSAWRSRASATSSTGAVDSLRAKIDEATDVRAKLRAKLPIVAAGALGAGFVLAGGIGATVRLFMSGSRESRTKTRFGRFSVGDRD